jgi:hypothetical protein
MELASQRGVLLAVGVVGKADRWAQFNREWMDVLGEFGAPVMHMTSRAYGTSSDTSWRIELPRRRKFLSRLTTVAKRGMYKAFAVGVALADYDTLNAEYRFTEELGSPDAVAQALCLAQTMAWLSRGLDSAYRAQFFMEQADAWQPAFLRHAGLMLGWQPVLLPRVDPNTGESHAPLQLADFIAHVYRERHGGYNDLYDRQPLRGLGAGTSRALPISFAMMDTAALREWCGRAGVAKRDAA